MSNDKGKRKTKYYWSTLSVLLAAAVFVLVMDFGQNSGETCGACHSMQPQFLTWQVSSHSQAGCVDCHADPGLAGSLQIAKDMMRFVFKEVTNDYITPIRMFAKVDDERCLSCHTVDRRVTSVSDIIIPHELHYDRKVSCVACHSSVVHGGIASRGETVDLSDWDTSRAVTAMAWENTAMPMSDCMSCHALRKVTNDCSACHSGLDLPQYHLTADFGINHGTAAGEQLRDCNDCHGFSGRSVMEVAAQTTLRSYSRENQFCVGCHSTRPVTHTVRWPSQHGTSATRDGEDGCLICHDVGVTDSSGHLSFTNSNCGGCHPSPHRAGWAINHRLQLPASPRIDASCYRCHNESRCTSCHGN
jgi:hypothetical protein